MDPFACGLYWKRKSRQTCKSSLEIELGRTFTCLLVRPQTQNKFNFIHSGTIWQELMNNETRNKLYGILPNLKESLCHTALTLSRKQESVMTRLLIGHTWITHSYLLKKEDQPFCHACHNRPRTVMHVSIECSDFTYIRNKFYTTTDVHTLSREVDFSKITENLKELGLYDKIWTVIYWDLYKDMVFQYTFSFISVQTYPYWLYHF